VPPGALRDNLARICTAEGVTIELPEPRDWSRWDPATRRWQA